MKAKRDHHGIMESTDTLMPAMTMSAVMPTYLRSLFMFLGVLFPETRKALVALDGLAHAADSAVKEHVQESTQSEDTASRRSDVISKVFNIYQQQGEKVDFQMADVKARGFWGTVSRQDHCFSHMLIF